MLLSWVYFVNLDAGNAHVITSKLRLYVGYSMRQWYVSIHYQSGHVIFGPGTRIETVMRWWIIQRYKMWKIRTSLRIWVPQKEEVIRDAPFLCQIQHTKNSKFEFRDCNAIIFGMSVIAQTTSIMFFFSFIIFYSITYFWMCSTSGNIFFKKILSRGICHVKSSSSHYCASHA